jgi:hypothetical protein
MVVPEKIRKLPIADLNNFTIRDIITDTEYREFSNYESISIPDNHDCNIRDYCQDFRYFPGGVHIFVIANLQYV